jgi:hypothetical protein
MQCSNLSSSGVVGEGKPQAGPAPEDIQAGVAVQEEVAEVGDTAAPGGAAVAVVAVDAVAVDPVAVARKPPEVEVVALSAH